MLDIVFLLMMALAVFNGVRNGLIVAIFSILGWILGLYAAFRFSDAAAKYLDNLIDVSPRTLSIISFVAVFLLVSIIVSLCAKLVEKAVELSLMGWLNRIGGIFFYVLLYTLIFSVLVFFAERYNLLSEEATSSSKVYEWVKPLAEIIQQPFLH